MFIYRNLTTPYHSLYQIKMQSLNANYSGGIIIGSQVLGGSISLFPIYPVR